MKEEENTMRIGEYPYTYARVAAMKAKLLKKADYDKLLKMRENEIARYLQDCEYKQQINKFGATLTGAPLVEKAIRENLTETLNKLRAISEGSLHTLINEYLKKEDFFNIKTILRGKYTKSSNDEVRKLLVPVGELRLDDLNKLISFDDIDKILEYTGLVNHQEIRIAQKSFKEKKQFEILEAAIDKVFYKELIKFIEGLPSEAKIIREFLAGEVDATNIKVILKFKREKIDDNVIKSMVFHSSASKIPHQKWTKVLAAKSVEQAMKELEHTPYDSIMRKGLEEFQKKNSLSELDLAFQKYLLKRARVKTHQNPLSIDVILSYMFAKEIEIRNLYVIIKSKQLGLKEEFITKELIL